MRDIRKIGIEEITVYDRNPRDNEGAVSAVAESIRIHGQRRPLILSAKGKPFENEVLCCGHTTLKALKLLGMETADCEVQEFESEKEFVDYNIRDNKVAELAEWDEGELKKLDAEFALELEKMGFEIEGVGDEIEGNTDEDDIPEVPEEPTAKLGQMWKLGDHRLMCGDSTDREQVERLMGGEKADMVFTDPPYGIGYEQNGGYENTQQTGATVKRKNWDMIKNDDIIVDCRFLIDLADEVFVFGADYVFPEKLGDGSIVVWDKRSEASESFHGSWFELCWSKQKHQRKIARIEFQGIRGVKDDLKGGRVHPTQKPVQVAEWFFDNWARGLSVVADLFGGSGSTLIACEKTGRKCRMMELDPVYCDVIIQRWEEYTGKQAELLQETEK